MSNHHPGNEWYRRLIRSNRPLYRACPKHTKLLVSKAIVQAVQQQGGRFLEHDKKEGCWRGVPYKRAVDKTSQGLRERDREGDEDDEDDDDDDNNGNVENKEEGRGRKGVMTAAQVPESFQGRSRVGPNLDDLAAVALAQANNDRPIRTQGQQPQPAVFQQPQSAAPYGTSRLTQPLAYGDPVTTKRPRLDDMAATAATATPTALGMRQSSMFRLMKQSPLVPGASRVWSLDSTPQQQPQQQLPVAPAPAAPAYPTKLNNLTGINGPATHLHHPSSYAAAAPLPPAPPAPAAPAAPAPPQPSMFSFTQSLFGQSLFFDPTVPPDTAAPNDGTNAMAAPSRAPTAAATAPPVAAPPLSRLTTQVSDWLTSFWPLQGKAEAERTGQAGYPSDPLEEDPFLDSPEPALAPPPQRADRIQLGGNFPQLHVPQYQQMMAPQDLEPNPVGPSLEGATTNVPFPRSRLPPSIQQQIRIPAPFNPELDKPVITIPPPSVKSPGKKKRKSSPNLPVLPYDSGVAAVEAPLRETGGGPTNNIDAPLMPLPAAVPTFAASPPTELEHSVSTTLLKLASTPSRLFSGFSSFFDRSGSTEGAPGPTAVGMTAPVPQAAELPYAAPAPRLQHVAMPRRGSKSTKSLLDDDEDTPMEARLRSLPLPAGPY